MKILIVLQFLLFSLFSISNIEQDSLSKNLIIAEHLEDFTPVSTETQVKSGADISPKYINSSTYFTLYQQGHALALGIYISNFKYFSPRPRLARSPPVFLI